MSAANTNEVAGVTIREGTPGDLPQVLELIKELARYEKQPDAVSTTVESMMRDGFGPTPVFGFIVAEMNRELIGVSLYYYRYSTWRGRCLYLEDLIVTERRRGMGIGKLLFHRTIQQADSDGCQGMSWQVLDWNEPAINFYRRFDSHLDGEWINCSLNREQIERFSAD